MPRGYYTPFTIQQKQQLKDEYLKRSIRGLASELGCSHSRVMRFLKLNDLHIPQELRTQRQLDSRKKKGHIPYNKGKKKVGGYKQKDYR